MIEIREPAEFELKELYKLRWKINRKPFGLPKGTEIDEKETLCNRFVAFDKGTQKIVGSVRLIVHGKIGEVSFMGVDKPYRLLGIGKRLMKHVHQEARVMRLVMI